MFEGVKNIQIENFKSIKSLQMPCKRLNIFIGEPNVGKSNILEALSLLGGVYSTSRVKYLSDFIRYEQFSNLFYGNDLEQIIKVNADEYCAILRHHNNSINKTDYIIGGIWIHELIAIRDNVLSVFEKFNELSQQNPKSSQFSPTISSIDKENKVDGISHELVSPFRKYDFQKTDFSESRFAAYLNPPHGTNLFHILMNNSELKREITTIFKQRGLETVFSKTDNSIELQKRDADSYIYKFPFANTADTFQRLLFYFSVIESNKKSVLILEEPEVHSFPPYITQLAERILQDTDNQYFITTHSPYFLSKMVEKANFEDLNICIAYFENYQTKVKILNENELQEVVDYGTDLFFNLDKIIAQV